MGKRYTKDQVEVIIAAFIEHKKEGLTIEQISEKLNLRGILTANGQAWSGPNLTCFIHERRKLILKRSGVVISEYKKTRVKPTVLVALKTYGAISKQTVVSIVTDPALNNDQRVKMIAAYLDA